MDVSSQILQFVLSGLTVGAIYAIIALGFTLIYSATEIVNLAQGEFVMLGALVAVFFISKAVPLPIAVLLAIWWSR